IGVGMVAARNGGTLQGNPPSRTYGSYQAMYDSVGLRWDILSDPRFPVEFDGTPPVWSSLPADSFPLVRFIGDLTATSAWSGRGALIVTGTIFMETGFTWEGIILAGRMRDRNGQVPSVAGTVVAGLNSVNPGVILNNGGSFAYHSCNVRKANKALAYLEMVEGTMVEVR
ncbi:MAG: hypothetical protein OEZ37_02010, partial [Gemmatimonadota bacterium]|nr:hypothetical protein [Gemmatimonadota bacterium]